MSTLSFGAIFWVVSSFAAIQLAAGHGPDSQHHFHPQSPGVANGGVTWAQKYGEQVDLPFSGPLSFSHLPYTRCLDTVNEKERFDIAILGMPFDTTVSYRPGARFGPFAIRSGSRRQRPDSGYNMQWGVNPLEADGHTVIDCGDVPIVETDNTIAMDQMEVAYSTLLNRPVKHRGKSRTRHLTLDGIERPRIVSLGGDHSIVLPILRSLHKVYGPITVIHFDAHLDTWYAGEDTPGVNRANHGTFFYVAHEEGLLGNNSIHGGIRCKLEGISDIVNDMAVGFQIITTDDIDDLGIPEIVKRIRRRVGNSPVYLSLDIDVVDPGMAPATGTPEAGGWTTRELKRIIRGLAGLNFVGADLVEVSPAYDHADITGIAAANLVHDFLSLLVVSSDAKSDRKRRRATIIEHDDL
ncbi:hypothetical protein D9611_005098 [Ephemerocybe angulata]|uniref:Agmatinase n=1 Tax=Ephemerocybe angulata TaxID=980116 RepID=A0A8H5C0B9_9AGAR|nr:hypothetical protein D9611_005098 [Tulosesus angulatus]